MSCLGAVSGVRDRLCQDQNNGTHVTSGDPAVDKSPMSPQLSRGFTTIAVGVGLLLSVPFAASVYPQGMVAPPAPRVEDYPVGGIRIGQGWNGNTAQRTYAVCINFAPAQDPSQAKTLDFRSVSDRQTLFDRLEVSAELQYKAIVASASAKTKFVRSSKLEGEYIHYAILARVQNGAVFTAPAAIVKDPTELVFAPFAIDHAAPSVAQIRSENGSTVGLTPKHAKLAQDDPEQFERECGTDFVSGVVSGSELVATLTFRRSSRDDQQQLDVALEGSGWGFTASGSVGRTLQEYAERKELQINYYQAGGSGDPIPTDQASLLAKIAELPKLAQEAPQAFQVVLESYRALPNWPKGAQLFRDTNSARARLARTYARLAPLRDDLQSVVDHPSAFILDRGVTLVEVKVTQDELTKKLKALEALSDECALKSDSACEPPSELLAQGAGIHGMSPDYAVRVRMPVRRGSFAEDLLVAKRVAEANEVSGQLQGKERERGALAAQPRQNARDAGAIRARIRALEDEIAGLKALLGQKNAEVERVKAEWSGAFKDAIVERWIRRPSRIRCSMDRRDNGCLSNEQIDNIAKMVTVGAY